MGYARETIGERRRPQKRNNKSLFMIYMEISTRPGLRNKRWKWKPGADIRFQLLLFWFGEAETHRNLSPQNTPKKLMKGIKKKQNIHLATSSFQLCIAKGLNRVPCYSSFIFFALNTFSKAAPSNKNRKMVKICIFFPLGWAFSMALGIHNQMCPND